MSEIKLFIDGNEVQLTSEQIEELSNKYSSYVGNPLEEDTISHIFILLLRGMFISRLILLMMRRTFCTMLQIIVQMKESW